MNNMKVLVGLEEMKYMALYCVAMYNKTHCANYRHALDRIVEKTMKYYGADGLTELLDFIQSETE